MGDSTYKYYEVIMIDIHHHAITRDPKINYVLCCAEAQGAAWSDSQWQEVSWSWKGTQVQPDQGSIQERELAEEEHSECEEEALDGDCPRTKGRGPSLGHCLGRNIPWIKATLVFLFLKYTGKYKKKKKYSALIP